MDRPNLQRNVESCDKMIRDYDLQLQNPEISGALKKELNEKRDGYVKRRAQFAPMLEKAIELEDLEAAAAK